MNRKSALAVLSLVVAGLLAWEMATPDDATDATAPLPLAVAARPARPGQDAAPTPELAASAARTILARPLFSPDRRPAPPQQEAPPAQAAETLPRLSGIVVGPSGRHAIFVDAAGHGRITAEGATIAGFTLNKIEPGQVTLTSSAGERVLHPSFSQTSSRGPGKAMAGATALPAPVPPEEHR
ncbi:MAG: hypothetical protein B7Z80_10790 [Rhodospirillales bacterium 20-64-7]|nr:MAG: hypothetical protein B7Z80_10790 [Rhodospirillales bacterium 20-64-7]HQT77039.1 hypothetical protein [Rhodopila sp.]